MKRCKFIKAADIILLAVIIIALILWGASRSTDEPCVAVIYASGREYMRVDLKKQAQDEIIELGNVSIYVSSLGEIGITEADCPDGVCLNSGRISKPGSSIACVPNKIVITVIKNSNYVDGVTG